jgi:hypothetical protein
MKWVIGAVVVPLFVGIIGLLRRGRKIHQSQTQRVSGGGHQKQSQSLEE